MSSFFEVITEAINDIVEHGFDTQKRVDDWMMKIKQAALDSLIPQQRMEEAIAAAMQNIYKRQVINGGLLKNNPGISRFKLEMLKPKLRNELDRRIMANAQIIKLNREQAIQTTLRRFAGWSTSIPAGGSDVIDKSETKKSIRKSLASLPFEERRVAIDQGHKFLAALNGVVATHSGAIAAVWHSRWRNPGYRYRKDHKERDERVYAIRGNWAMEKGLMRSGPAGYTDEITQPGEEVFCSCQYVYVYNLTSLPEEMLTEKGKREIEKAMIHG